MNPYIFVFALSFLIYRAYTRRSLTPPAILAAVLTACIHGTHAYNLPFVLLITFYALGTAATKVKHDVKATLTVSATGAGGAGGDGARGATQVFANSVVASALTALSAWNATAGGDGGECFADQLLMVGVIVNYAAVTADTLSSELGILSRSGPRLITTSRRCAPGTNGGVSMTGLIAGACGAGVIAVVSVALLPWCASWSLAEKARFAAFITGMGTAGSLLDSLLGALLQASVVDTRTGKVVEAPGGGKVLVLPSQKRLTVAGELRSRFGKAPETAGAAVGDVGAESVQGQWKEQRAANKTGKQLEVEVGKEHAHDAPSRRIETGWNILSNNGVNFAMAALTSVGGMMLAGWAWYGQPLAVVKEVMGV